MKLLALRSFETGEYLELPESITGVEVVKNIKSFTSIADAIEQVPDMKDIEGFVLDNGQRVKLKTFWYCEKHKLIDFFSTPWMMKKLYADFLLANPDNISTSIEDVLLWNPAFDGCGDDVIANITELQRIAFRENINAVFNAALAQVETIIEMLKKHTTKKSLGLADVFVGKNIAFKCFEQSFETFGKSLELSVFREIIKEMSTKHFISSKNCTRWLNA